MSTKINAKIAFFGATGGCVNASLIRSLLARYDVPCDNVEDVKRTLALDGELVSIIISGVADDQLSRNLLHTALLNALRAIYTENPSTATSKPLFAFVSTTGISNGPEDVPFWFRFLYRVLVAVPGADKRKMETGTSERFLRGIIDVRASLLTGGIDYRAGKGRKTLRVGTDDKPAVGHMIPRSDVGEWIFEEVVKKDGPEWAGKIVTLTS
ncbi:hypothetical protein V1506DRAFT_523421 [Lipomyces tetrasporus]